MAALEERCAEPSLDQAEEISGIMRHNPFTKSEIRTPSVSARIFNV